MFAPARLYYNAVHRLAIVGDLSLRRLDRGIEKINGRFLSRFPSYSIIREQVDINGTVKTVVK